MKKILSLLLCTMMLLVSFAGCKRYCSSSLKSGSEPPPPSMAMDAMPLQEAAPVAAKAMAEDSTPSQTAPVTKDRKIIYTAEIKLEVKNYDDALAAVKKMVADKGGFIADSRVDVDANGVRSGEIRIRVPSDKFNDSLSGIKGMGDVKFEAEHGNDVTEEYFDLETRLANSKKMEGRLLDLLEKQTKSVKDLLEVEKELGRVREDIETKEGRKRFMDDRLSFSTITIYLQEPYTYTSSVFDPLKDAWSSMWGNLIASIAGVISFVFAALPWAVLIGFAAWIGIKLVRRWLKKRAPKAE